MYYATHDSDGNRISENANIMAFETEDEMREWLQEPFFLEPGERLEITLGWFGDCWIKMTGRVHEPDSTIIQPFTLDGVSIREPGSHPGGHFTWIEPMHEVHVAVLHCND